MRRVGLLAFALTSVAALASANAADIYIPGPGGYKDGPLIQSWAGFYIGAHVGGEWSDLRVKDIDGFTIAGPGAITKSHNTGVFGGVTLGYNLQRGPIVFGFEGDLGGMQTKQNPLLIESTSNAHVGIDDGFYGDVTGRLGYSWARTLLYAKGGFAFLDADRSFSTHLTGIVPTGINTFTGWTMGGGIEYMINPAWSLKVEYLHFDFGHQDFSLTGGNPAHFSETVEVDTVKAGVNYHIGSGYLPLK
jgi:opacity protein-like surface antigen